MDIFSEMKARGGPQLRDPADVGVESAPELYAKMSFDDLWHDAEMTAVVTYLRGNSNLDLPNRWRRVFPTEL